MKTMISVVIPLYNKAHTIERTLSSVLEQSFHDFEVVIVDDGSTDNGADVIRTFTQDSRVRIVNQTNQGVSAARNKGVASARYEYIAFLDGDDEWSRDYLTTMKQAIEKYPQAGMFCCAGIVRNADGTEVIRLARKYAGAILEINFFENPHVFLHTSATIVAKKEFNKTSGFPVGMKRNQDFALFFSLALITPVVYCGFPLSVYVGGVQGQATATPESTILLHKVNRYNTVYKNWLASRYTKDEFRIFMKYELRHEFMSQLRKNNYRNIDVFLENLNKQIITQFPALEMALYKNKLLRWAGIIYIAATKIRWRMRGYPQVGESA
ncbi:glycosyltransferase family 2 protein [Spirosoma sp. 209]|uniref:glycosyltransferase family 2 protein n=1 Tax=Spirosoma sp. 209 TaxID=1955701 RepID=UPI00191B9CC3|nr:glycosyltransferase family 2 protein [Spirosoma sp. 209]